MNKIIAIFIISSFVMAGCYYDKEELLYPQSGNCDTANSTYSTVVQPALQTYGCLGCHSGPAPSGNVLLNTYANVKSYAQNNKLYGSITHSSGFSPMPQGGNKMNACLINKIKAWIDAGSLNN
jgi:hypothetical protein